MLTNQTAYTKVFHHLMRDGYRKSATDTNDGGFSCKYAGPGGNSCAIGCLLPRELGKRLDKLEHVGWANVAANQRSRAAREATKLLSKLDADLLRVLQYTHDHSDDRAERLKRLKNAARRFKLKSPAYDRANRDA